MPRMIFMGLLVLSSTSALADDPDAEVALEPTREPSEVEKAAEIFAQPLVERRVVRNDAGGYDLWLFAKPEFERVAEALRLSISGRRLLPGGMRLDAWTWLEADRSYLVPMVGPDKTWRLRLTRHLHGSLVEVEGAGLASEAPKWSPPWRPKPILLPHGPIAR